VLPGTELWKKAEALELDFDPAPPYFVRSHKSMSPSEITYGWKIVDAMTHVGDSRTVRLLSRETDLTFADVVDEWIGWRPTRPEGDQQPSGAVLKDFVAHVCRKRQVPEDFYSACAHLEYPD
jgi:hypothetical protein